MTADGVIDAFAVIGVLASIYWAAGLLMRFLAWVERSEIERQAREDAVESGAPSRPTAAVRGSAAPAHGISPEEVAAIAGAIAMLGDHRIVHIHDDTGARVWTSEGRWHHHTSHKMR